MRQRRKSYFEANRRISILAEIAAIPSQSTIVERLQKQPTQPVRASNRLKGIGVSDASLIIVSKRQTRSKNLKNRMNQLNEALSKDVTNVEQPRKIQCRRVTVALERMNTDTINDFLGIEQPQNVVRLSQPIQVSPSKITTRRCTINLRRIEMPATNVIDVSPAKIKIRRSQVNVLPMAATTDANPNDILMSPTKITARRCTVNLQRMDFSKYRELSTIDEQEHGRGREREPEQIEIEHEVELEHELADGFEPQQPIDYDEVPSSTEFQARISLMDTLSAEEGFQIENDVIDNTMSTIISDQNIRNATIPSISPELPFTPSTIVAEAMEMQQNDSKESIISLDRMNLDDDQTTYFHETDASQSTHLTQTLRPTRNQLLQSSQTHTQISWFVHGSCSDDSIAVGYSQSNTGDLNDSGSERLSNVVELKKSFIDSPHISFDSFIKYERNTFAVNHFDHGNENIRIHFLSKFCRAHFPALNEQFTGHLFTTRTTGNSVYSFFLKWN